MLRIPWARQRAAGIDGAAGRPDAHRLEELRTHLRGVRIVLRGKTPDLVRQEFHGLPMTHFAVRGLLREEALKAWEDPERLCFLPAVRVVRGKLSRQCSPGCWKRGLCREAAVGIRTAGYLEPVPFAGILAVATAWTPWAFAR